MLMYGSVKGSRWLILPWLVATFLFILAYIAGMILSTILFGVTLLSIAFLAIAIIEVSNALLPNSLTESVSISVVYRSLPLGLRHLPLPAPGGQAGQQPGLGVEAEAEHQL